MKHVIYRTEYYHPNEIFCYREEEYDAYFNTFPDDKEALDKAAQPPIGCRLLLPKLVLSRLTKEQWETLIAKKPDYQLRYASLFDTDERYAIYAIYERIFKDEDWPKLYYIACVSFGENKEVTLDMCVIPEDYDTGDNHYTFWEEDTSKEEETIKIVNAIRILSSVDPQKGQRSLCIL